MLDDVELLRRYASRKDEDAFTALVGRYVNLVYSAARRQSAGNSQMAEEIAQAVFIDLARKAPKLVTAAANGKPLAGWLFASANFAAKNLRRSEMRRQLREHSAYAMNSVDLCPQNALESEWLNLRPMLDDAMKQLSSVDRDAILLRFFENKDLRSVGIAMGFSEEAARKRVSRALERLRTILEARGISASAVALSAILSTHATEIAPVGLAAKLTQASLAAATTSALSSTLSFLFLMSTKSKVILGAAAALLFMGGVSYRFGKSSPTLRPDRFSDPAPVVANNSTSKLKIEKQKFSANRGTPKGKIDFIADALGKIQAALTDPAHATSYPQPEMKRAIAELREFYREAVPLLVEALHDSNPEIRRRAAGGLAFLSMAAAEAIPDLIELLGHAPEAQDAVQIAAALQSIGVPESATPALIDALSLQPQMRDIIESHFPDFIKTATQRAIDSANGRQLRQAISDLSGEGDDVRLNGLVSLQTFGATAFDAIPDLKDFIAQPNREDLKAYAEKLLKDIDPTFLPDSENPDTQASQADRVRLFTERALSGRAGVQELVTALRELPDAIPVAARSLGAIGYEEMGRRFNESPQGSQDFLNATTMLTQIAANNQSQEARIAAADAFQKLQPMQPKLLYTADEAAPAFAVISNTLPRLSETARLQIQSRLGNMFDQMKSFWAYQHRSGEVSDYQGSQIATFAKGLGEFDQSLYTDFVAAIRKTDPKFLERQLSEITQSRNGLWIGHCASQ